MTIKEFSQLCECTAQTLRYYDSIDLLKPARVDRFTGYRYYDSEQALDYVKIKNLQNAMFSIGEIKDLLNREDEAIAKAIDVKIEEQKTKLETLIQIQKSYRSEFMKMQDIINKTRSKISECVGKYDAAGEYGISEEYYRAIIEEMNDQYDQALVKMKDMDCPDLDEEAINKSVIEVTNTGIDNPLNDANNTVVIEENGWKHTSEILAKMPSLEGEHILYFELDGEKWSYNDFCYVVLKIVQNRNKDNTYKISCIRNQSKDGKNHFWLLKR